MSDGKRPGAFLNEERALGIDRYDFGCLPGGIFQKGDSNLFLVKMTKVEVPVMLKWVPDFCQ